MSNLWSGLAVTDANLNKMVAGDGSASGLQAFAFSIVSDGAGSGSGSFAIAAPSSNGISVAAYDTGAHKLDLDFSGKTLIDGVIAISGTPNVQADGHTLAVNFNSGDLRLELIDTSGATVDWDSKACRIWVIVITSG